MRKELNLTTILHLQVTCLRWERRSSTWPPFSSPPPPPSLPFTCPGWFCVNFSFVFRVQIVNLKLFQATKGNRRKYIFMFWKFSPLPAGAFFTCLFYLLNYSVSMSRPTYRVNVLEFLDLKLIVCLFTCNCSLPPVFLRQFTTQN